jgi:hypothetical protein
LRNRQLSRYYKISPNFVTPQSSLPCSQEPSTGSYPEPDQPSSYHPGSSYWALPVWLSRQYLIYSSSPNSCYILCPSHPLLLYYYNYTWLRVQVMKLLIMYVSPTSRHFISLRSKYSPQHPVLKHPQSMFLP